MSKLMSGAMTPEGEESLRDRFVAAMSRAAQTVNVITTDGPQGRAGVTVTAMASVSADTPQPTLLVCVNRSASAAGAILANGRIVVNVLRDDQAHVADVFAGRHRDMDRFASAEWVEMPSGLPRLAGALVAFDCRITNETLIGTHHVLMAEVEAVHLAPAGRPLIYAYREYSSPTRIDQPLRGGPATGGSLSIACFHSFGPSVLPEMLRRLGADDPGLRVDLVEGDQRRVDAALRSGEVELAMVFDMELGEDFVRIPLTELPPYVLLPAGHPLADRPRLAPKDLADLPMVLISTPPSGDYFLGIMRKAGVEPRVAFRSSSYEMVRGMVGQGLGYAILATRTAVPASHDGSPLVMVPLETDEPPSRIVLARRRAQPLSPAAERFVFLAQEVFATDA